MVMKEAVVAYSKSSHSRIFLEGPRKTTKHLIPITDVPAGIQTPGIHVRSISMSRNLITEHDIS
jgi:hypothetical protein